MTKKYKLVLIILCLVLSLPFYVQAQCDPKADACAPQKDPSAWDKSLAFGFNLTDGNSETTLLNLGIKASKDYEGNIWDLGGAYGYGKDEDRTSAGLDKVNKNDFRANASYNRMLNDSFFAGLGSKVLYDEIADVDYRTNIDPTIGNYFIKDNTFKFKIEGGPSYVFEKVGGIEDDYFAPRVADRFDWALSCTSKIYQTAEYFIDVSDSDNYIFNAEIGVEAALTTALSLVLTLRDTYDNQPAADREKNDLAIITALKVAL